MSAAIATRQTAHLEDLRSRDIPGVRAFWIALACACVLLSLAVNGATLDMDEGFTAWMASHHSFGELIGSLRAGDASDLQMALYYIYEWNWVRLFGGGEYALRASNLPFGFLFAFALGWTSWRLFRRPAVWVPLALSPVVWFYMNEARAYLPMISLATASTAAMLFYLEEPRARRAAPWLCLISLALAIATHVLATLLIPVFIVLAAMRFRRENDWRGRLSDWRGPLITFAPVFFAMATYYTWTFSRGTIYTYGSFALSQCLFTLYILAGLAGLGPSRDALQNLPLRLAVQPYWPWLLIGGIGMAAAAIAIVSGGSRRSRRQAGALFTALLFGYVLVESASFLTGHRFPARHLAALLPLMLFGLLAAMGEKRERAGGPIPLALALVALVWAVSDIRLSFMPEHQKSDYKTGVKQAIQLLHQTGGTLLWTGDVFPASYYGLRLANPLHLRYYAFDESDAMSRVAWPISAYAIEAADWTRAQIVQNLTGLLRSGRPVVVAVRKCDLIAPDEAWLAYVSEKHLHPVVAGDSFDLYVVSHAP